MDPMKRAVLSLAAIAGLAACWLPGETVMRADLRAESARQGLALVGTRGKLIVVVPFDGPDRYFESELGEPLVVAFGRGGRMVAWYGASIWNSEDLIVTSINGDVVVKARAPARAFIPGALSENGGLLQFSGSMPDTRRNGGLYWANLDLTRIGFIDALAPGDSPFGDWSPDGRTFVYAKERVVYLFDMSRHLSSRLTEGLDPTWAPNGRWISFRALDGQASLVTLSGQRVTWPVSVHKALGPIRWTPDGGYVSFPEAEPQPSLPFGAYYRLAVCRASDGRAITARKFGAEAGDFAGFHWILDYKEFCRSCKAGQPFN
jgi:hypothetical protein